MATSVWLSYGSSPARGTLKAWSAMHITGHMDFLSHLISVTIRNLEGLVLISRRIGSNALPNSNAAQSQIGAIAGEMEGLLSGLLSSHCWISTAETFNNDDSLSWWREQMQTLHLPSHRSESKER